MGARAKSTHLAPAQAEGPQVLRCCWDILVAAPTEAGPDSCQKRLREGGRRDTERRREEGLGVKDSKLQAVLARRWERVRVMPLTIALSLFV